MATRFGGDRLLDLYYEYFWRPFPMVLPHSHLRERLHCHPRHGLEPLIHVLQWIGSVYALCVSSQIYYETALQALQQPAMTPFNVQALALLALGQYNCGMRDLALATMAQATAMGLNLGMNRKEFAQAFGEGSSVLEESWRRTYYVLYTLDQKFALIQRIHTSSLVKLSFNVDLPCDDEAYESGGSTVELDLDRRLIMEAHSCANDMATVARS
jgi:hypothetical protein